MDLLKGCHFKDAADVNVASKVVLQKVTYGGFQKYLQQLYEFWQICVTFEEKLVKGSYI